jgi:hypothetical protein
VAVKDYKTVAAQINKDYPNLYHATSNVMGVCVYVKKGSLPHCAAFLESSRALKGKQMTIREIAESGLLCIR